MRVINEPVPDPDRCITLPPGMSAPAGDRYVNFGTLIDTTDPGDYTVILCESRVREAASALGLPSAEEYQAVWKLYGQQLARAEEMEKRALAAEANVNAVDQITSAGFRARQKKGPKAKEPANV